MLNGDFAWWQKARWEVIGEISLDQEAYPAPAWIQINLTYQDIGYAS